MYIYILKKQNYTFEKYTARKNDNIYSACRTLWGYATPKPGTESALANSTLAHTPVLEEKAGWRFPPHRERQLLPSVCQAILCPSFNATFNCQERNIVLACFGCLAPAVTSTRAMHQSRRTELEFLQQVALRPCLSLNGSLQGRESK